MTELETIYKDIMDTIAEGIIEIEKIKDEGIKEILEVKDV